MDSCVFFYVNPFGLDRFQPDSVRTVWLLTIRYNLPPSIYTPKSLARSDKKTNEMQIVPEGAFCYDYSNLFHNNGFFRFSAEGTVSSASNCSRRFLP